MDLTEYLNPFYVGEDLIEKMTNLPDYDPDLREKSAVERVLATSDITELYVPTQMSIDIYTKIYQMTYLSLKKKSHSEIVKGGLANFDYMKQNNVNANCGVITGLSSSTIIGPSGVGKSVSVQIAMGLVGSTIDIPKPKWKVIPCLLVQTPFDCSYKTLLFEILKSIDKELGTEYYERSFKSAATANQLLGMLSQLCQNHIGLLIIDEIQNIVEHKAGRQLYRLILQLINTSCNVIMVGTPECENFFMQDNTTYQFARRSVGLKYSLLPYDKFFENLIFTILKFNYLKKEPDIDSGLVMDLYKYSGGNISVVISLIQSSQEMSILNGYERLDSKSLKKAFDERFAMLHPYIVSQQKRHSKPSVNHALPGIVKQQEFGGEEKVTIAELVKLCNKNKKQIIPTLKEHFTVIEVAI